MTQRDDSRGFAPQSPVGTIALVSTMRMEERRGACGRCITPFGMTTPWRGRSEIIRPSRPRRTKEPFTWQRVWLNHWCGQASRGVARENATLSPPAASQAQVSAPPRGAIPTRRHEDRCFDLTLTLPSYDKPARGAIAPSNV